MTFIVVGFLLIFVGKAIGGLSVFLPVVYQFSVVTPLTTLLGFAHTKGAVLLCMPKGQGMPKEQCMGQ